MIWKQRDTLTKLLAIIPIGLVAIISVILFFRNIRENNQKSNYRSEYFSGVDYSINGKMLSKTLAFDAGTESRNLYIIEMAVDTFLVSKRTKEEGQFFGIYDTISSKAYFISTFNVKDEEGVELPDINIISTKQTVYYSNGHDSDMILPRDLKSILLTRKNNNSITF
ncbi:MAG: hypothetical protein HDR85_06380 [Bacteroides sp.]|nr:hypothetical protein [Bacteroides sp.]MDE6824058.1 hypothetical protein [Duncaniella sp.]